MMEKLLLTSREAAALLGVHVDFLRQMVAEGRVPFRNLSPGKARPTFRFLRAELEEWVRDPELKVKKSWRGK